MSLFCSLGERMLSSTTLRTALAAACLLAGVYAAQAAAPAAPAAGPATPAAPAAPARGGRGAAGGAPANLGGAMRDMGSMLTALKGEAADPAQAEKTLRDLAT